MTNAEREALLDEASLWSQALSFREEATDYARELVERLASALREAAKDSERLNYLQDQSQRIHTADDGTGTVWSLIGWDGMVETDPDPAGESRDLRCAIATAMSEEAPDA